MTSMAMAGKRLRTGKPLNSVSGFVERLAEGRIRYANENLGRLLLVVDWDRGGSSVVFPEEVSILDKC